MALRHVGATGGAFVRRAVMLSHVAGPGGMWRTTRSSANVAGGIKAKEVVCVASYAVAWGSRWRVRAVRVGHGAGRRVRNCVRVAYRQAATVCSAVGKNYP